MELMRTTEGRVLYYESQYRRISALLEKINPCEIRIVDGLPQCTGNRAADADADEGTLCCTGCAHLGSEGCKVMALGCKMWLCTGAINNLLRKSAAMPTEVCSLLKEIQETYRICEFFEIPCRSRHSLRENMDGIINENGFKPTKNNS